MTHSRHESWSLLCDLNNRLSLPWMCSSDFNELISNSEKLGGANRNQSQMQLFHDVIDECGFIDLGFRGSQFSWQKHFVDGHSIWERLDRNLANNELLLKFGGTRVHHLHSDNFDHCPL